jgi:hypothetical protein
VANGVRTWIWPDTSSRAVAKMALCGSQGLVFRAIADSSAVTSEDGAIGSYTHV